MLKNELNDPCLLQYPQCTLRSTLVHTLHRSVQINFYKIHDYFVCITKLIALQKSLSKHTRVICCISCRFLTLTCFKRRLSCFFKALCMSCDFLLLFSKIKFSSSSYSDFFALLHRKMLLSLRWFLSSCKCCITCRSTSNDNGHTRVLQSELNNEIIHSKQISSILTGLYLIRNLFVLRVNPEEKNHVFIID